MSLQLKDILALRDAFYNKIFDLSTPCTKKVFCLWLD